MLKSYFRAAMRYCDDHLVHGVSTTTITSGNIKESHLRGERITRGNIDTCNKTYHRVRFLTESDIKGGQVQMALITHSPINKNHAGNIIKLPQVIL